jgi:hypothetical protein
VIGDKRAIMCADCAYALPDPAPVDRGGRVVDIIIAGQSQSGVCPHPVRGLAFFGNPRLGNVRGCGSFP